MITLRVTLFLPKLKHLTTTTVRRMSTEESDVIFKEINGKGLIILNRPKALNALNLSMVKKLYPKLEEWEQTKSFVVVKGAGEKSFCAGGDVRTVVEEGLKGNVNYGLNFFKTEYTTNGLIGRYKIPYIAVIDGIVMGGGVGLSVHGKYRIATERTLFAMPETQIGLFPDVGGSYFLNKMPGRLGVYLALTGHRLKGVDVLKSGVATHFCQSNQLGELEEILFKCENRQDLEKALSPFADTKGEFSLTPLLNKINHCFAPNNMEDILGRLKSDNSEWAQETLKLLGKMSPTSMKVTLKELDLAKNMSLKECLEMEYNLAAGCLRHKDFYEGVRALLIDKDQNPKWDPPSLNEVTDDLVNDFFQQST